MEKHTPKSSEPTTYVVDDNNAEALAAVQRLTTLFADVKIDNWEGLLDDPMLELANAKLPK